MAKKKKKLVSNYMDIIYVQSKDSHINDNGHVEIHMEHTGLSHRIAQKFFHKPKTSYIELDTYGTAVWKAIDGSHTVHDILLELEQSENNDKDRLLDRLVTFLTTLENNRFIEKKEGSL